MGAILRVGAIRRLATTVAAMAALGCIAASPALGADSTDLGPFGPLAGFSFDPVAMSETEPVPPVPQPDASKMPVFNTYFGSGMFNPATDRYESVAVGADASGNPRVYVASSSTDRVYVFDGKLPLNPGAPPPPLFTFGTQAGPGTLQDARGIAYYRGEIFVVDRYLPSPGQDRVVVYDSAGNYKRSFPLLNPRGVFDMTGVDVIANEVWVTGELCGGLGGVVEIFDAPTGAIKGVVPHVGHAPTGDPSSPCDESKDPSSWWDVALAPELNAGIAQYRLINRGLLAQLDTPDAEILCTTCFRRLWLDGTDAAWGMRWFLAVDGSSSSARGTGVTEYSIESDQTGGPFLQEKRRWAPRQAASGGVRDIAYLNRETRIDWTGHLTEHEWQRDNQCLTYVVSDGDIFAAGAQGEHWLELARGFTGIEFFLDGKSLGAPQTANPGTFCMPPDKAASGHHVLTAKATVQNGAKTVTETNNDLPIDITPPTGSVDSLPAYVTGTTTVTGQMADAHSGPRDWQLQLAPAGGAWSDLCGLATLPEPATGKFSCAWDTTRAADGTYSLRGSMRDKVDAAYGGANAANTASVSTTVDNTPPSVQPSGDLLGSDSSRPLDEPRSATVAAQDSGSGVTSIEVQVDGVQRFFEQQGCGGGCSMTRQFTMDPNDYADGAHTVRAIARDALGHTGESSFGVVVEHSVDDRAFDQQYDEVDQPDTVFENPGPDDVESSSADADLDPSTAQQVSCAADDEWGETIVPEYFPPELDNTPLAATPQAALVRFMLGDAMPLVPPSAFQEAERTADRVVYNAKLDGQLRAFAVVERIDQRGWGGTYYEGCSKFPQELLTSQLPTSAGSSIPIGP